MINGQAGQGGFLDTVKSKIQVDTWLDKIRASKGTLIDIGLYAGIGFLAGFLFKKYSRYVIALLLFVGALFLLQQYNVITIGVNADKMYNFFGLQPAATGQTTATIAWGWIKANMIVSISFAIGFLFGLRVG